MHLAIEYLGKQNHYREVVRVVKFKSQATRNTWVAEGRVQPPNWRRFDPMRKGMRRAILAADVQWLVVQKD
jgi:hypothetical protein